MNPKRDKFYNRFSFCYPLADLFFIPQKKILFKEINALPHGDVLEIGVGNGSQLKQYKKHRITGIDASGKMLERAKKKNPATRFIQMDAEALSFPGQSFDYIVLSHVIAVVDSPDKVLEETYRVLKPGGRLFILNHFTPGNWLKFVDVCFQWFGKLFHFRSVFYINDFLAIKNFREVKEIKSGRFGYFKLLIYRKP